MLTSDDTGASDGVAMCEAPETSTWRLGCDAIGRSKA
jgi:hypothetical protein